MDAMINDVRAALEETGAFTSVSVLDDASQTFLGREPLAAVQYGGMATSKDGDATVETHRLMVYVKLISLGTMDTLPLKTAYSALELAEAASLSCAVHSTDSRSVTFVITASLGRCAS